MEGAAGLESHEDLVGGSGAQLDPFAFPTCFPPSTVPISSHHAVKHSRPWDQTHSPSRYRLAGGAMCSDLLCLLQASSGRTAATFLLPRGLSPRPGMPQASSRNALGSGPAERTENQTTWSFRHFGQGSGFDQGRFTMKLPQPQMPQTGGPSLPELQRGQQLALGHTVVGAQALHLGTVGQ